MKVAAAFTKLTDADLGTELERLLAIERRASVELIACLAEFDDRRLYLPLGYSSLFVYCRDRLHLSDGATYRRIAAARLSRRFPEVLGLIGDGSITLTNLALIAPHMTPGNSADLLRKITHRIKTEVEEIVARVNPKPDAATLLRRLPARARPAENQKVPAGIDAPAPSVPALIAEPPPRAIVAPLAPQRYKLQITIDQKTHDTLKEVQALMRHTVPNGDIGVILERALTCLVQELLRRKCGARRRDFTREEDDVRRPEKGGHRDLLH